MKKRVVLPLLFGVLVSGLVGCNNPSSSPISSSNEEQTYEDKLASSCQEGVILHAFNWSFDTIKDNLKAIKEAGYTTVQTSPVQQPRGGGANWWALYQPVSFSIATSSTLGNKQDLKELCEEADKYGIKIISDIVFNHMGTTGNVDADGFPELDPDVKNYEPEIYNNINTMFHRVKSPGGIHSTTHSYSGLPDLNTSNEHIQKRALDLLKECIDVGVDGFRFDAAKHIETPSDGSAASSFWDNTLEVAKVYYKEKTGQDLYAYGEILNDCENGRKLSIYTDKYFGVTDNQYSDYVITKAGAKKVQDIVTQDYFKETTADKLVLWAESHDTYEGSSIKPGQTRVNRAYAIVASRKDATSLFFARPSESSLVGEEGTSSWESEEVACVNRFHNRFIGAEENLHAEATTVLVTERYSESDCGAVLVSTVGNETKEINFNHLKDGKYYDTVSGREVNVVEGKASVVFETAGIVVLTSTPTVARPSIEVGTKSTLFVGSIDVKLKSINAEEAYYQINDGEKISFLGDKTVKISASGEEGEVITLKVVVKNGKYEKEKVMKYTTISLVSGYVNVVNLSPARYNNTDLYIWAWNSSGLNVWTNDYEIRNGVLLFDPSKIGATGFLLATFPKGYTITDIHSWDSGVTKQTTDISASAEFYDASSF